MTKELYGSASGGYTDSFTSRGGRGKPLMAAAQPEATSPIRLSTISSRRAGVVLPLLPAPQGILLDLYKGDVLIPRRLRSRQLKPENTSEQPGEGTF